MAHQERERLILREHSVQVHSERAFFNKDRSLHNVLVLVHGAIALAAFAITIAVSVYAFGGGCDPSNCMPMIHITSTFFSTAQVSSAGSGWAVATERSQIGDGVIQYPSDKETYSFSHYYECMNTAQMADKACPPGKSVPDYMFCLRNNSATNAALTACNAIPNTYPSRWPTPEEYMRCLFSYPVMQNSQSYRTSQNVFQACVQKSMWPFFEMQQGVDSPLFLGSFNWLIMVAVGMICMTSFAVYTVSFYEQGNVKHGSPQFCMRLGSFWSGLSALWILVFLIICITIAYNDKTTFENNGGVPTTISTSMVSVAFLSVVLFYFLGELSDTGYWNFFWVHAPLPDHEANSTHNRREGKIARVTRPRPDDDKPKQDSRLGAPMPRAGKNLYHIASQEDVSKYYTPPLIASWADGYLADACIFIGLAGATGQLTTSLSWQIFSLVFFYRLLNMMIARFMYECFMNNASEDDEVNTYKVLVANPPKVWHAPMTNMSNVKLSLKAMALSTQIAALYLIVALGYLIFNSAGGLMDFEPFYYFFIFGFIVPEFFRIGVHVYCQVAQPKGEQATWLILNPYMIIWSVDLLVRVILVSVVVFDTKDTPGTRKFLLDGSNALVRDYLPLLYVQPLY